MNIRFTCNGKHIAVEADPGLRAIDVLRDILGLTGVKEGCGRGECGACTIIVDGKAVNSCMMLAPKLQGTDVTTIEGLTSAEGALHPIQEAFLDTGAVQCGFCTPGMVLSAKSLLDLNPDPGIRDIEEALSGNICRCTGYKKIVEAVQDAGQRMHGKGGLMTQGEVKS